MGANPHANGGKLLRDLHLPDFRDYALEVGAPGIRGSGDTRTLGPFLRDVANMNEQQRNFRVFGPDETMSNGLGAMFESPSKRWMRRYWFGSAKGSSRVFTIARFCCTHSKKSLTMWSARCEI